MNEIVAQEGIAGTPYFFPCALPDEAIPVIDQMLKDMDALKKKNTCKDCKWWDVDSIAQELGVCDILNKTHQVDASYTLYGIAKIDDVVIVTAPDFGCVHWEARE